MSIWQTKKWQEFLIVSGQSEAFFEVDGIFFEKRKISFGNFGLFAVGVKQELTEEAKTKIFERAKKENCLFFQVENLSYGKKYDDSETSSEGQVGNFYKKFIPPYTVTINLEKNEDTILAEMKPKGRYNINLAKKKGVECKIVEKTPKNIEIFYRLFQETTSRDDFAGNTLEYYTKFLQMIDGSELIFAYYQEKVIAGGIFVFQTDVSLYYYGASSNENREVMAPYLLQWTAILEAKKRGSKLYDFLGVAGPDEKKSPLAGVTQFKTRLQPNIQFVSESKLFVVNKKKYFFIMMLKKLQGMLKK